MEANSQQTAADLALEAQRLAAVAQDAAVIQALEGIRSIKDFEKLGEGIPFEMSKWKSRYISRYGFDRFEKLCGRSRT